MHATPAPLAGIQAPLPGSEAALVGLAALAVVIIPFLWPLVEYFNVMAHEGAHAVVGSAMGFGIKSVKLGVEYRGATGYHRAHNTGPRGSSAISARAGSGCAPRNSSRTGMLSLCYGSRSFS